jgi:signal transduction histidine kinase
MSKYSAPKQPADRQRHRGLSLQQRLSLLIFLLLISVIVICSYISYIAVRNTAIHAGEERLKSITQQLSSMFGQTMQNLVTNNQATAALPVTKRVLGSGGKDDHVEMLEVLKRSIQDKVTVLVILSDTQHREVIRYANDSTHPVSELAALTVTAIKSTPLNKIGNLHFVRDSMYYPLVIPVMEGKTILGYLTRWRLQYATPQSITQFSLLLGSDAKLFVGNRDGSLWTDLGKRVKTPPVDTPYSGLQQYRNLQDKKVFATAQPIPQTSWLVLVEFSKAKTMEAPKQVLRWLMIAGAILIVIGLLITWLFSRNITRPLNRLRASASAIARGEYSIPVAVNRTDEVGELARSFNSMKRQVQLSQQELENKVQERTFQLETANKELEAFSYSVSHDLRAPLRAVNGYAVILKEDYVSKMDEEANRLADKIILNSKRMGQLIDDLIAFSQMGSKELMPGKIDMDELVKECLTELLPNGTTGKYQVTHHPLPDCQGDKSLIKQVWMNLIGNAIKYSAGSTNPHIEIGHSKDTGMQTYFVKDNGVGFNMKYADKLFGVFQRLHSSKAFEGTGIGLAFAKRIIEKHKGRIWADASQDEGAVFYFSLPINNQ